MVRLILSKSIYGNEKPGTCKSFLEELENFIKAMDQYFALLGVSKNAALKEIKNAYRARVKEHHPDRFTNEADKAEHAQILVTVNEAYQHVLDFLYTQKKIGTVIEKKETDYNVYKKGLENYQIYFDSFFQLFAKRKVKTGAEKIEKLKQAVYFFNKIITEYPGSEWRYDARQKLKDIEKALSYLKEGKGEL